MFYSGSTGGFYAKDIHETMPSDAVEISDELYAYLIEGQSQTKKIQPTAGGIPALVEVQATPFIPQEVTAFQARAALASAGILNAVTAHMAALPADDVSRLAWEYAVTFKRTSPTIAGLAPLLGLSDAQLDALFVAAAQIDA